MLEIRGATVTFAGTRALDRLDLTVPGAGVTAVLGPSGSGKSTLLRAVAGLQPLDEGSVLWEGADVTAVAPEHRSFGLMFQDFALFPHLDVAGNIGFGLRMQGVPPEERAERVAAALERVELPGLERRRVESLSGGQAQRVALARALAPQPRMLLLDEPLGSLDRTLRERLVLELGALLDDLALTALYVTHDQEEAFAVADEVAVLLEGRIAQLGAPAEVWRRPASPSVARFLGHDALVDVTVRSGRAVTPLGDVDVEGADGPATLLIRPDALSLGEGRDAVVVASRFAGGSHRLTVEAGGIVAELTAPEHHPPGTTVAVRVDPSGVVRL